MTNHSKRWGVVKEAMVDRMHEFQPTLRQAELVRQSGVNDATIRGLMQGKPRGEPDEQTLDKIEYVLQMPRGYLHGLAMGRRRRQLPPPVPPVNPPVEPVGLPQFRAETEARLQALAEALAVVQDGVRADVQALHAELEARDVELQSQQAELRSRQAELRSQHGEFQTWRADLQTVQDDVAGLWRRLEVLEQGARGSG